MGPSYLKLRCGNVRSDAIRINRENPTWQSRAVIEHPTQHGAHALPHVRLDAIAIVHGGCSASTTRQTRRRRRHARRSRSVRTALLCTPTLAWTRWARCGLACMKPACIDCECHAPGCERAALVRDMEGDPRWQKEIAPTYAPSSDAHGCAQSGVFWHVTATRKRRILAR